MFFQLISNFLNNSFCLDRNDDFSSGIVLVQILWRNNLNCLQFLAPFRAVIVSKEKDPFSSEQVKRDPAVVSGAEKDIIFLKLPTP